MIIMAITNLRSKRKPTGGILNKMRKKFKRDFGNDFLPIKIGQEKKKLVRGLGGNKKSRLMGALKINVMDPSTGKVTVSEIISVKQNTANPHFVRMNVVTKGAVVETKLGEARITSRPGQHGIVNAILLGKP
jgi:small subunit ribosomal protein S8e